MRKINGKGILGVVAGLGLLTLSAFSFLKKNNEDAEDESIYNEDEFEVEMVDEDETDN